MSDRIRAWWRVMKAQLPIAVLVLTDVFIVSLIPLIIIILGAYLLHSWPTTYGLLTAHTAPSDPSVKAPAIGYLLSIVGWLAAPAIVGAIVGSLTGSLERRSKGNSLIEGARKLKGELAALNASSSGTLTDARAAGAPENTTGRTDGNHA